MSTSGHETGDKKAHVAPFWERWSGNHEDGVNTGDAPTAQVQGDSRGRTGSPTGNNEDVMVDRDEVPTAISSGIRMSARQRGRSAGSFHAHAMIEVPRRQTPTRLPAPLKCAPCKMCRVRHRSTFKCRVDHLHLFAPSWEDDQDVTWVPPDGFIRWLWGTGAVEGCKVRSGQGLHVEYLKLWKDISSQTRHGP